MTETGTETGTETAQTGKTAIITGAGRGLGRAMTLGMVAAGARVTMADIDQDVLADAAAEAERTGGQGCVRSVVADVTDATDAETIVRTSREAFGRVDILVNDAALGPQILSETYMTNPRMSWEVDPDLWRRTFDVNANGPFMMIRAALPHMLEQGWGRIVNVTTSLNTMYQVGCAPYGPTKAALEAYTALLAQELEGTGVTANVLVPGGPANTRMIPDDGIFAERDQLIQPTAMVAPLRWLTSEAAGGINGRRFIAAQWDADLPADEAAEKAGAPAAWPQLGLQAIRPDWE